MMALDLYILTAGLLSLGILCIWKTSHRGSPGGDKYVAIQKRRLIGKIFIIAAATALTLGLITQFSSREESQIASVASNAGAPQMTSVPIPTPHLPTGQQPVQTNNSGAMPQQPPTTLQSTSGHQAPVATQHLHSDPFPSSPIPSSTAQAAPLLKEAFQLMGEGNLGAALAKVNAALQAEPKNSAPYALRGNIYAAQKQWLDAQTDYQTALQIGGKNASIEFNLAELNFMQKRFDAARAGFIALEADSDLGDLSTYKVFLCDLFGGHIDTAAKELDALNQVGSHASYYFANAAWSLYHQKTEDARGWLTSAAHIYPPEKFKVYSASLIELGYPGRLSEHP